VTHNAHLRTANATPARLYPTPPTKVAAPSATLIKNCADAACFIPRSLDRKRDVTALKTLSSTQKNTNAKANGTAVSGEAYIQEGRLGGHL
jgi:hypothetical protein